MKDYAELNECLCCGNSIALRVVFDLGMQPLANQYHDGSKELNRYPLALKLCRKCFHLQLSHSVDPKILFGGEYAYMSGISQTMKDYYEWFAKWVFDQNQKSGLLVEIACNDGSQLDEFKKYNFGLCGIEPSTNMSRVASDKGYFIINDFFPFMTDRPGFKASVIVAQNVFAHVPDPYLFLINCAQNLCDDGVIYIQTSQADMVKDAQFDTVYHEHISFFNIKSMQQLVNRAGLVLMSVQKTPVHGNSWVFSIKKSGTPDKCVELAIIDEAEAGLYKWRTYQEFEKKANQFREEFKGVWHKLREADLPIIGYGCSAKGMNLLNFTGCVPDYIVDDTPFKQGKLTPGTNIKVAAQIPAVEKAVFIPLAWNFYDEIKAKIKAERPDCDDIFLKFNPSIKIEK